MPGKLRIAARSDLFRAMRRKMASSVSFLPTTTSMIEATLACSAAIGGGEATGLAAGVVAIAACASGAAMDCGAAAVGAVEWLKRHPRNAAAVRAHPTTAPVANILIREEFFQVPRMLRGTGNS